GKAKAKDKADYRCVIVVDQDEGCRARRELGEAPDRTFEVSDWTAYFDRYLGAARRALPLEPQDYIVPSPHMPHLMFEWVVRRARRRWPGRGGGVGGDDLELPRSPEPAANWRGGRVIGRRFSVVGLASWITDDRRPTTDDRRGPPPPPGERPRPLQFRRILARPRSL